MSQAKLLQTTVLDVVPFGNTGQERAFFALRLAPPNWKEWRPGQFVMLRPKNWQENRVWARPFSICHLTKRDLVIFFQVKGRGTADLARLAPGDILDMWGPLGNGFAQEKETPTLLLAGGIGIAPFVGYAHSHPSPWALSMEFGHRMPLDCYPFDSLNEKIDIAAHWEQNAHDRNAFLTLIDKRIAAHAEHGLVLACGPTEFLRTVQRYALKYRRRTQLCLETRMGCGIGACLGCVVQKSLPKTDPKPQPSESSSYLTTCTNGPNFWADQVVF